MSDVTYLKNLLGVHPNFPKRNPIAFETLITHLIHHILTNNEIKPDVIVGLDARGFLLGPIISMRLGCSFVPIRKGGKLPGLVEVVKYEKEYGIDEFEIQSDAIKPGQNVIVIDDLIATGGSAHAAGELIKKSGGKTLEYVFIVGLPFLKGHEKLDAKSYWIVEAED